MEKMGGEREVDSRSDKQLIKILAQSKIYRQYQHSFNEVTGLPLALHPMEFYGLPFHGKKNENPFCAFLNENKKGCRFCMQAQAQCAAESSETQYSTRCLFGLTETTVPIRLNGRAIGFLCTGQVFTHSPVSGNFGKAFRTIFDTRWESEKAKELWSKTAVIESSKYEAIVQLLVFFANQLSAISNQIVIRQKNAEPIIIENARKFIARNKTEVLSLRIVAKAVGSSLSYFCKTFHRVTGEKFTDYVTRVRLEEAKSQLVNPNLHISEIAYAVGFQSLAQFNRAFQKIFGQSPSECRKQLTQLKSFQ